VGLLEAVAVAEEDLLDGLFAVSLETSLLPADVEATPLPLAVNKNDNDNYNAVAVAEEDLLDELFAVSLETSLLPADVEATPLPLAAGITTKLPSPAVNKNDNDNNNDFDVAEEDLLDGIFAVSLETSLFSEEKTMTTSPVNNSEYNNNYNDVDISLQKSLTGKSDDVIERVSELPSHADSSTDSSVHQLDNSSSRKVSILLVEEDINNEAAEDNSCTLDTDEDEDMVEAEEERLCENCNCIACKDGEVIASTLEFGGRLGCKVAVANCVTSYWGNGYRAQRGEVAKIDSTDRVTVQWVDGSESQFNVHPTERPETDTVLCFHCR